MTGAPAPDPAPTVAPVLNAANGLTALRILLVPVFVALVIASQLEHAGWRIAACLTFAFASATDLVDGWIARRYGLVTPFGKVADPIADKALTGAALVLLSWYGALPWWVTAVILVREWGITLMRLWVIRYGVIAASRGGKLKTALQIVAIAWYLWPVPDAIEPIGFWIMTAAVVVTVVTGLDYILQAIRLRQNARHTPPSHTVEPTGTPDTAL
ncbi:CDP-diacylglycerol--glycerol-3-phosphate 3-phosphatidyltransferase [Asanoa siamensis]|uniref:CDP-diacylglycerol--glycerol-3-phosphate 3-phosphatidyltransferase n=1 Tax=Asanoa siamensis TaxID=926357 RepID=A0ABQ4CWW8_9ACTN|nr:CDP-diacylglycerol--glycerol-3-phosphate 3-phosphatidyltransferase [Asanoa siamensis]GIF75770.1 CDP-diacylglycerol--glycerol-3-phosphate 3-phosphatidyltransferase [Asanoa siamensis]